jgi:hypothetical protein
MRIETALALRRLQQEAEISVRRSSTRPDRSKHAGVGLAQM